MSKYQRLWEFISEQNRDMLVLTFAEIEKISGMPIDHSFLSYKKELSDYGFSVSKISMKNQTVKFERK
ncbi:MAG: hypothetical protein SO434_03925 [Eubacteriales bacterium]|nr:hypothetical protein [Eubacteriales bacterium]